MRNTVIKNIFPFNVNFVGFGVVLSVFVPGNDTIQELERVLRRDMRFVTSVMISF